MDRRAMEWLLCLALAAVSGCADIEVRSETEEEKESRLERQRLDQRRREELNNLWLQGYGIGNDNADRRRQGLPPKNFDGTTGPHQRNKRRSPSLDDD